MWYPVRMRFPAICVPDDQGEICTLIKEEVYEDAIRASSPAEALERARWNWPTATDIEVLPEEVTP